MVVAVWCQICTLAPVELDHTGYCLALLVLDHTCLKCFLPDSLHHGSYQESQGQGCYCYLKVWASNKQRLDMITKVKSGESSAAVAPLYSVSESIICTVFKNKVLIKNAFTDGSPWSVSNIVHMRHDPFIAKIEIWGSAGLFLQGNPKLMWLLSLLWLSGIDLNCRWPWCPAYLTG